MGLYVAAIVASMAILTGGGVAWHRGRVTGDGLAAIVALALGALSVALVEVSAALKTTGLVNAVLDGAAGLAVVATLGALYYCWDAVVS